MFRLGGAHLSAVPRSRRGGLQGEPDGQDAHSRGWMGRHYRERSVSYTVEPACKVHGCKVFSDVRSILAGPNQNQLLSFCHDGGFPTSTLVVAY